MMEPSQTRPQGITILAILAAISGVLGILASLAIVLAGGLIGAVGGVSFGGLVLIYGLFTLVLSIATLAVAYGFWTLASWGYRTGLYVAGAGIVLNVLGLLINSQGIFGAIIGIAIDGAIIYYLMTPPVKAAFGQK